MRLVRYTEFTESLLLESKMFFSRDFRGILSHMKLPIAKHILGTMGKEVDITQNYINLVDGKDDTVSYIQANRIKPEDLKSKAIVTDSGEIYGSFRQLFTEAGLGLDEIGNFPEGTECEVVRVWTVPEIKALWGPFNGENGGIYQLKYNGKYIFIGENGIRLEVGLPEGVRSTEVKVGRLARRILDAIGVKVHDKEIEEFVNQFKTEIAKKGDVFRDFELVSGKAIIHWYDGSNYVNEGGTISGSCMRYSRCSEYFGIYVENPEVCQLLILKDSANPEKIRGRALVWKLTDGSTFMDRAYFSKEAEQSLFVEYAIKHGWKYKKRQSNSSNETVMMNGEEVDPHLDVSLKLTGYNKYPYLDTLKFFIRSKDGYILTNSHRKYPGLDYYTLEDTEGGNGDCETCGGSGRVECDECGGNGRQDCDNCDGDGVIRCRECDGDGRVECDSCDGDGEFDCTNCDGEGKIEDDEGNKIDCPDCNATGKVKCDDCNGRGKIECDNCNGSGEYECSDCDGRGRTDCSECDGSGQCDCPDCN